MEGLVASDQTSRDKHIREQHFPSHLIEKGLEVDCKHASACKEADKDMILKQIGDNVADLNSTIHGVVAGCYARQYLQKEQGAWKRYLDKISRGKLKKFQVDLSDFTGDKLRTTGDRLCELLKHLDSESLKQLRLSGVSIGCDYWGNCLSQFRPTLVLGEGGPLVLCSVCCYPLNWPLQGPQDPDSQPESGTFKLAGRDWRLKRAQDFGCRGLRHTRQVTRLYL